MEQLYCLMTLGGSLNNEQRTSLTITAQHMMRRNETKLRLLKTEHGAKGWMYTSYKYGMMGSVGGFVFRAEIGVGDKDIKVEFIVRPIDDPEKLRQGVWRKTPLFDQPDLSRN